MSSYAACDTLTAWGITGLSFLTVLPEIIGKSTYTQTDAIMLIVPGIILIVSVYKTVVWFLQKRVMMIATPKKRKTIQNKHIILF